MNCDDAIEFLPWLLNGSLEAGEGDEVRRHLATCERCRAALNDTREAWTIFGQHLPSEALVALAYAETPAGIDPALAERHLASCPECAAELELARTSRRLEEDGKIAVFPGPRREKKDASLSRSWRASALAAGLAALVAGTGWIYEFQQAGTLAQQLARKPVPVEAARPAPTPVPGSGVSERQLAEVQSQLQHSRQTQEQLNQEINQAKKQLADLSRAALQPQINTWTGTVTQDVVRDGNATDAKNDILPSDQPVTLTLNTESPKAVRKIEITDSRGNAVFSASGLREKDLQYQISFPKGTLKPGRYTIQLYETVNGQKVPRERYSIRVQ